MLLKQIGAWLAQQGLDHMIDVVLSELRFWWFERFACIRP